MTDRAGELPQEFSGASIDWESNPQKCRFLRLTKSATKPNGEKSIVVGVARKPHANLKLFFFYRQGDFEAEAYRSFPSNPNAKPSEAVDTAVFLLDGYPRRQIP